ncbi:MAG: TPM domain-containing protein [Bacteroidetes bacterium]|nr:TPM domain-containing protein [Bacteroidota bacterium]
MTIFTEEERNAILAAIAEAEKNTSGEIRVFIDDHCHQSSPLDKAAYTFNQLEMYNTKLRNGVLIYLSIQDRKFAIIGDTGIHDKVGDGFWHSTRDIIMEHLRTNKVTEGIIAGVREAGNALSKHFPFEKSDQNELPNNLIFGNN